MVRYCGLAITVLTNRGHPLQKNVRNIIYVIGDYFPPLVEIESRVFVWATLGNTVKLTSNSFQSSCDGHFNSILISFWTDRENVSFNIDDSYFYSDGVIKRLSLFDSYQLAENTQKRSGTVELHSKKSDIYRHLDEQSFYPSGAQLNISNRYQLEIENSLDCESKDNYLVLSLNGTAHRINFFPVKYRRLEK